ncbi:MAG: hypothetical protein GY842_16285 [bacterium]|nr:hypothetical protein [bacterium]
MAVSLRLEIGRVCVAAVGDVLSTFFGVVLDGTDWLGKAVTPEIAAAVGPWAPRVRYPSESPHIAVSKLLNDAPTQTIRNALDILDQRWRTHAALPAERPISYCTAADRTPPLGVPLHGGTLG